MTELHKIDREKLAEALHVLEHGDVGEWDKFREETGATPHVYRRQAAENWLTITDPGFEVSDGMVGAGQNIDGFVSQFETSVFKAMIAKAGEP